MEWITANIRNTVKVSRALAEAMLKELELPQLEYIGRREGEVWAGERLLNGEHLYFCEDHGPHMDWLYEDVRAFLAKHKVEGDIAFGSMGDDYVAQFWCYRFDGQGGVQKLRGLLEWATEDNSAAWDAWQKRQLSEVSSWDVDIISNDARVSNSVATSLAAWYPNVTPLDFHDPSEMPGETLLDQGTLWFPRADTKPLDWLRPDICTFLSDKLVRGDIKFGTLLGGTDGQFWGYRFNGEGQYASLKGTINWSQA